MLSETMVQIMLFAAEYGLMAAEIGLDKKSINVCKLLIGQRLKS
jgi:hypothetical protein